jgi:hypothetical protein
MKREREHGESGVKHTGVKKTGVAGGSPLTKPVCGPKSQDAKKAFPSEICGVQIKLNKDEKHGCSPFRRREKPGTSGIYVVDDESTFFVEVQNMDSCSAADIKLSLNDQVQGIWRLRPREVVNIRHPVHKANKFQVTGQCASSGGLITTVSRFSLRKRHPDQGLEEMRTRPSETELWSGLKGVLNLKSFVHGQATPGRSRSKRSFKPLTTRHSRARTSARWTLIQV